MLNNKFEANCKNSNSKPILQKNTNYVIVSNGTGRSKPAAPKEAAQKPIGKN